MDRVEFLRRSKKKSKVGLALKGFGRKFKVKKYS